jgi:perosamine synthetase
VALIEDAAHALGASFPNGTRVGSSSNLTCFSFYANKNLSTGEGGAIALFDEPTALRLRSLRLHGLPADAWKRFSNPRGKFESDLAELGYKMNYTDLQAAIGRIQLKRQAEFHKTRLAIAKRYETRLSALTPRVKFQTGLTDPSHARHLFVILWPADKMRLNRDEVLVELRKCNIGVSIHYYPLHKMHLYGSSAQPPLPVTDSICHRILTLPISSSMTVEDADFVLDNLSELVAA